MSVKNYKKTIIEPIVFLVIFIALFGAIGHRMGAVNMLSTLMNTAYELLMNTVFYIMAIAVLAGAIGSVLSEFGVIGLINTIVSPLMKPVYGLPGAASVGVMTTYLSDNPAILALADDKAFIRYFRKYQVPALTNIGTAFGMGAIITTFVIGLSVSGSTGLVTAAIVGNVGAIIGSIVSTRLMLIFTKKEYGTESWALEEYAEKLLWLINNEDCRKQMGINAYRASRRYGIEGIAAQWNNPFCACMNVGERHLNVHQPSLLVSDLLSSSLVEDSPHLILYPLL
jgi:hypothetical protein